MSSILKTMSSFSSSTAGGRRSSNQIMKRDQSEVFPDVKLLKLIDSKLSTSGGVLTGSLDLGGNRISGVGDAANESDAVNLLQLYRELQSAINPLIDVMFSKKGDQMLGDLNMNNHRILYISPPTQDNDIVTKRFVEDFVNQRIQQDDDDDGERAELSANLDEDLSRDIHVQFNKKYLQIYNMTCEISVQNLVRICKIVSELYMPRTTTKLITLTNKFESFCTALNSVYMTTQINSEVEKVLSCIISYLKYLLISTIESLPRPTFNEFENIVNRTPDLLLEIQEGTPLIKICRFISKFGRRVNRNDPNVELVIQKSFLFIDLGFHYISDQLLHMLIV